MDSTELKLCKILHNDSHSQNINSVKEFNILIITVKIHSLQMPKIPVLIRNTRHVSLSVFNGELLVTTECLIQLHYKDPPLDSLFTFNIVHI